MDANTIQMTQQVVEALTAEHVFALWVRLAVCVVVLVAAGAGMIAAAIHGRREGWPANPPTAFLILFGLGVVVLVAVAIACVTAFDLLQPTVSTLRAIT